MSEKVGGLYFDVDIETANALEAVHKVNQALGTLDSSARTSGKGLDNLDKSADQTGAAFSELTGYARSMDGTLKTLNSNVNAITRAMQEAGSSAGGAGAEFTRAEAILENLGNQLAILDEAQENGARSAAILAAQIRAGSKATDEEKQKIGELTGRLYDMKTGVDTGAKSHGNWKSTMQQAGYQVQDFIVQVQGGQSALVAFAQQGSQMAGAFGPGGAVLGAVIALGSVIAGTLITSLNGGKNAMDALKDAAEDMDKVITISQNGVAALSDKYALLAKTNAEAATILRNQAMIEYNAAVQKIPKSINDASSSIITFTDKLRTSFSTGEASIDSFSKNLSAVGATSNDFSEAMEQARGAGARFVVQSNSIQSTVQTLAEKFGISEQSAFKLSKQLSDVANNPTPEALQKLVIELQNTHSSSTEGAAALVTFLGPLTELVRVAGLAQINLSAVNRETDNLTSGQKNLIKQSERNLALSRLQGEARARLQAQYAAEDSGFDKDDPRAKKMEDEAAATYKNTQAQKNLQSEHKRGSNQAESIAQKLANLKQQSELAAGSTKELSREQAILTAQQSLGKGATQEQIALAGKYAAATWDSANALKAKQQAEQGTKFAKQEIASAQSTIDPATGQAVDPLAQVNLQEQQKLEALAKYQEIDKQNTQLYESAKTAIMQNASMQRRQIQDEESDRQQQNMSQLLGSSSQFFGEMAGLVGDYAGESSAAYKTLFAVSKAFSIAQATMNMVMAISNAAALPWPANIPAMAVAAAQGANLISQIRGSSYGGGREHGGPMTAGVMYRVGEGNKPELMQTSKGMFMVPGDNGRMFSNKEITSGTPTIKKASTGKEYLNSGNSTTTNGNSGVQSGGGLNVQVVINNQVSNAQPQYMGSQQQDGNYILEFLISDADTGGPYIKTLQSTLGLRRQANGAL
ncbi:tail protein (tape measure) [Pluralibacter gergoviae]|uniref:tail protein (tape measure) n=1 Tax=Pluralibacter gergoviae TaxID=61647 RepID=UPI0004F62291|nr:tail protein (tape measure) [Pluralibacter gergoviae]AIQ99029.1 tail protein (tape measure) [Pluralibacter gergoviae]MCV7757223.1 tail protein (tape measure) [Pluralibacter gergoviae]